MDDEKKLTGQPAEQAAPPADTAAEIAPQPAAPAPEAAADAAAEKPAAPKKKTAGTRKTKTGTTAEKKPGTTAAKKSAGTTTKKSTGTTAKKTTGTTAKKSTETAEKKTTGTTAKKSTGTAAKKTTGTTAKKTTAAPRKRASAAKEKPADTAKVALDAATPVKVDTTPETAAAAPQTPPDEAALKEKRAADMTRTLQITIEQIMQESEKREQAQAAPMPAAPEPLPEEPADEPEDEAASTAVEILHSIAKGVSKWLLLVVLFVAVIAGSGVAWLYRSATPDMIPQIEVSFAGQEPPVSAYNWKIPVVGHIFRRTYKQTVSAKPVALALDVEDLTPRLRVAPVDYTTSFTVSDAAGQEVYNGTAEGFSAFRFTANGDYTAKLVVTREKEYADETEVIGSETRLFSFTVARSPSLRISPARSLPGTVAAVCAGKTLDGKQPQLQTSLPHTEFMQTANGWVCYLPLAWDTQPGSYEVVVTADGFIKPLVLTVAAAERPYVDYYNNSQLCAYYIGEDDMPAAVKACLPGATVLPQWRGTGFAEPIADYKTQLSFGMTEYVGRPKTERDTNPGTGGRTSVNVVLSTAKRGVLTAPAAGRILLADELPDPYGNTLVIDHGSGLLSIFYGLQELEVKHGDDVEQGQELAKAYRITIAEMRLMGVPIDPEQVWQNRSDALKQQ